MGKSADGLSKLTMVVRMKIKPSRNPTCWWGVGVGLWPELNSGYRMVCSNDDCPEVGAVGARSSGEACAAHECGDHGALEIGAQVGANGTRWYDGAEWALGGRSGRSVGAVGARSSGEE